MKVAVLDDEPAQLDAISEVVRDLGYEPQAFTRASGLLAALRRSTFDLLILDWLLPDREGLEVIQWVRTAINPAPPMLLVTSRNAEADVVRGLESGADDYLPKPFTPAVLAARIRALLRRSYAVQALPSREEHAGFVFDLLAGTASRADLTVDLTPKEMALVLLFFRNAQRALSRSYLVEAVWGSEAGVESRTLDMHVSRLRTKLRLRPDCGYRLTPIYSYGYKLEWLEQDGFPSEGEGASG